MEEQEQVNAALLRFAKKYNVKIIASNDSHYIDQEDADAHDILLCVNTGELKSTPIGDGKGYRFGFPNNEFYFKPQAEMNQVFSDLPQAIDNTNERSEEHTSELQSLMRISYAVFCLTNKKKHYTTESSSSFTAII